MKQALARSLHSTNLKQQENHCAIDNVHLMGLAAIYNPIGVASIHAIDALQANELRQLIYSLSRKAGKQLKCDKRILLNVCRQVIYESAIDKCQKCTGVAHRMVDKKVVHCDACNGTGLNRHTDYERSRALKISEEEYTKYWAKRFNIVQSIYTGECRNALHTAKTKNI